MAEVLREEVPAISRHMTWLADLGDHAVDRFARSPWVLMQVSRRLGGRPVRWVPERMLWREVERG